MTTETTAAPGEPLDDGIAIVARAQGAASFLAGLRDRGGDEALAGLALLIAEELGVAEGLLRDEREDSHKVAVQLDGMVEGAKLVKRMLEEEVAPDGEAATGLAERRSGAHPGPVY